MQKWEYLHLDVQPKERTYAVNGVPGSRFKENETTISLLNDFGYGGWELVTAVSSTYLFKRPREE